MYLSPTETYYKGTEQCSLRAPFLLLLQLPHRSGPGNVYAVVRMVALRQFGQFMTGKAKIGSRWENVSGAYGGDGLPMTINELPKDAVKLPRKLYDAWSKGGGWNSAGVEAPAMRKWAIETFKENFK